MHAKLSPMLADLAGLEGDALRKELRRFSRRIDSDLIAYLRFLSSTTRKDDRVFSNFARRLADECLFLHSEMLAERVGKMMEDLVSGSVEKCNDNELKTTREDATKAIARALENAKPTRELVEYMIATADYGDYYNGMLMMRIAEEASARLDDRILTARCRQKKGMIESITIRKLKSKKDSDDYAALKLDSDKLGENAKEDFAMARKVYSDFGLALDNIELDVCEAELLDALGLDSRALLEKSRDAYLERRMAEHARRIDELIAKLKK